MPRKFLDVHVSYVGHIDATQEGNEVGQSGSGVGDADKNNNHCTKGLERRVELAHKEEALPFFLASLERIVV